MLTRREVDWVLENGEFLDDRRRIPEVVASLAEAMEALEHRLTASHAEAERCAECAAAAELVAKWKGEK